MYHMQRHAQRIKEMIENHGRHPDEPEIRHELQQIAFQVNAYQPIDSFPDISSAMFYVFVSIIAYEG